MLRPLRDSAGFRMNLRKDPPKSRKILGEFRQVLGITLGGKAWYHVARTVNDVGL